MLPAAARGARASRPAAVAAMFAEAEDEMGKETDKLKLCASNNSSHFRAMVPL